MRKTRKEDIKIIFCCIGFAFVLDIFMTIEWTYPYCKNPEDGAAFAVFGFPFPYESFAGNSLEYLFLPHFFIINVTLIASAFIPIILFLKKLLSNTKYMNWIGVSITYLGILCFILLSVFHSMKIKDGLWIPVSSLDSSGNYIQYSELRPMKISFKRHYDCENSRE